MRNGFPETALAISWERTGRCEGVSAAALMHHADEPGDVDERLAFLAPIVPADPPRMNDLAAPTATARFTETARDLRRAVRTDDHSLHLSAGVAPRQFRARGYIPDTLGSIGPDRSGKGKEPERRARSDSLQERSALHRAPPCIVPGSGWRWHLGELPGCRARRRASSLGASLDTCSMIAHVCDILLRRCRSLADEKSAGVCRSAVAGAQRLESRTSSSTRSRRVVTCRTTEARSSASSSYSNDSYRS